jgi:hypothetical protein
LVGGSKITLKLGDIIQIYAAQNDQIHEQTFFIEYIDETIVILLDIASLKHVQLYIDKEGNIRDETINQIYILSRAEEEGYARQNSLVPKTWIDIYIGGDVPAIITGEITNLEQDMIEVTTFPEMDVIYIDFAYKGLPRDIPIKYFEIRNRPASLPTRIESLADISAVPAPEEDGPQSEVPLDLPANKDDYPSRESTVIQLEEPDIPDSNMFDVLKTKYIKADAEGIVFGEELDEIAQMVEVPESQRRYGIETQANDLMDELLSTIPNSQRTKAILEKIHNLIERFKQLRNKFSQFDENGNVSGYIQLGALYKPIVDRLHKLDTKLDWILPVVKQRRFLYSDNAKLEDEGAEDRSPDVLFSNIKDELDKQKELFNNYYKNTLPKGVNKYENLYAKLDELNTSFIPEDNCEECLTKKQEILTNLDTVIDNLDEFYSTTVTNATEKSDGLSRRRFVIQRYNLGIMKKDKQLMRSGKTVYTRNFMTPSNEITVKSLLVLPEPVVKYSHIGLPATNILTKVNLHQTASHLCLFRLLRRNTDISTHIVDNLDKEVAYAMDDIVTSKEKELPEFLANIKEYLLDENLQNDPDKYRRFLNAVVPKTRVLFRLIRKYIKDKLSFVEVVKELEPFAIYTSDISYKQHDEIRYFIKTKIGELKQELMTRAQLYKKLRRINYQVDSRMNHIKYILFDNRDLLQMFESAYKMRLNWDKNLNTSEVLNYIVYKDGSILFSDLVATMMAKTLFTPNNILDEFEPAKLDDLSEMEKIKARDCSRRYLAKQYKSINELWSDNGKEDVFYDKDLDDTVYSITDKYKAEKKAMSPPEFYEFLRLNLIHKFQVFPEEAEFMARTLIEGKKRVRNGEYAVVLEDAAEKGSPPSILKYYFKRINNQWVEDTTIDDFVFYDTNTLFCNITDKCFKNETNQQCESNSLAQLRMIEQTKMRMKSEFDIRLSGSIEELERKIKGKLEIDLQRLSKEQILNIVKLEKYNTIAYDYGRGIVEKEVLKSPHWKLRELILGQDDFQKRQLDIIEFVDMYCREPMIDELNENPNWLYCLDSNIPLFPQSLWKLAAVYIKGGDYSEKLAEICKDVGVLSDDGDSIVDKHTGYVLRKIDFVTQDEYTEEGMKIVHHAIMEEDLQTRLGKMFQSDGTMKSVPEPIFENKQNQMVYNIMRTICNNIAVPLDSVQSFVMNTTGELMEKIIQTPELYEERAKLMERKKGVRPIPYEIYKDRLMFWIVASCLLISIQIAIPSIRTKKTFPGCVRSFSGYPLVGGVEDQTGIEYIACVLFKSKSSTAPWNSIEKLDLPTYISKIREMLEKIMGDRPDIGELYTKKQEFLLLNPDQIVPEEHSVEKWRHFLPPLMNPKMTKRPQPISKDYEREMMDLFRDGHRKQREHIGLFYSRLVENAYAIIESVNDIVKKKDVLLRTSGKIPFLENACCQDMRLTNPIKYFVQENKDIIQHIEVARYISDILKDVGLMSKASILYHPGFTGIKYSTVGEVVLVENIYKAFFHYCNFDNDLPIPDAYRAICPEKPTGGYDRDWTLLEKVEFLKLNGKQYRPENLEQLMIIVRNQNRIVIPTPATFTQMNALRDLLEGFQMKESIVVEGAFRQRLMALIDKYNPQQMVKEPRKELDRFKNYLAKANEKMYYEIVDFMDKHGNMSNTDFDTFQNWLLSIFSISNTVSSPNDDHSHTPSIAKGLESLDTDTATHKEVQNIKTFIYYLSKLIPEMILNKKIYSFVPKHWELAPIHVRDIERVLDTHWNKFQVFFDDTVIYQLLREIMDRLIDMYELVRAFPVYNSIFKNEHSFHSFMDLEAIQMVYSYFVYSTLYEYIVCSENPDLLRTDLEETKKQRRQDIADVANASNQTRAEIQEMEDDAQEINLDLNEINIRIGTQDELKGRVAKLLRAFMDFEIENRSGLVLYRDIIKKTGLSKKEEKKRITDYLGSLPNEEREVEKMFMKFKMGAWNVGQSRGIFEYDKSTYERERQQEQMGVFATFMQESKVSSDIGGVTVEELDKEAEKAAEEEHDAEGYDIGDFGEDYTDGNFYGDDARDEE